MAFIGLAGTAGVLQVICQGRNRGGDSAGKSAGGGRQVLISETDLDVGIGGIAATTRTPRVCASPQVEAHQHCLNVQAPTTKGTVRTHPVGVPFEGSLLPAHQLLAQVAVLLHQVEHLTLQCEHLLLQFDVVDPLNQADDFLGSFNGAITVKIGSTSVTLKEATSCRAFVIVTADGVAK